jgi:xylan 1,4-beta-xylosidase
VERYGRAEVAQWYWEVWNEPNSPYWHGSQADYFKLYDYAVAGVRRALPEARVGGPETAGGPGGTFLHDFLEHCARGVNFVNRRHGSPLDFISFHAKGAPSFTNDHVRMGMSHQFQNISEAFAVIAASPEFRHLPIVIGESDPEGCAACREPRDAYRNGTMYSSYTAASFPREYELAAQYGVNLAGALTWAFEFEDQPPFAGFRALAGDGIDLPVLNVFRMFGRMNGRRLAVSSTAGLDARSILASGVRGQPDISAMASLGTNQLCVLVWHYHDDDVSGPAAAVSLAVDGLPAGWRQVRLRQFRIDADHSNSYQAWQKLGQPLPLTPAQRELLQRAGQLAEIPMQSTQNVIDGKVRLKFDLPRQGVVLWQIEPMD